MTQHTEVDLVVIGTGGAADVFRSVVGGVPLAVKVLRSEFALDREMMDRFAQEVAVVDALRHAGIPECYGHGFTSDGRPFAAFALVKGETLRDRIIRRLEDDKPAPGLARAVTILGPVARVGGSTDGFPAVGMHRLRVLAQAGGGSV